MAGGLIIYISYSGRGLDRVSYFFRSDDIGKVHKAAREEFGPGVSFSTREADEDEIHFAEEHHSIKDV